MPKISAVLPSSLSEDLARRAHLNDRSFSAEIRRAVRAYLEQDSPSQGSGRGQRDESVVVGATAGSSAQEEGS